MSNKNLVPSSSKEIVPYQDRQDNRFSLKDMRQILRASRVLNISIRVAEFAAVAAAITGGDYYNGENGIIGAALLCGLGKTCEILFRKVPDDSRKTADAVAAIALILSPFMLVGGIALLCVVPNQPFTSYDESKNLARVAAACEILKGKDNAEVRTPYFKQVARWGRQDKIADMRISMELVRRDTDNFTVRVKENGHGPRTEMYRPYPSMFAGYERAKPIDCKP